MTRKDEAADMTLAQEHGSEVSLLGFRLVLSAAKGQPVCVLTYSNACGKDVA